MCNGDGIPNGACDCAGNVEDCAGDCDGSAEVDECGECGGNNECLPWTELTAVGGDNQITLAWFPLGDDRNRDFSLSITNVDTEAGTLDINLANSEPVAGFQFNLTGINITGASGGSAGANGFMISSNSTTIIGFSLTGGTIPAGSGTLVNVAFTGFGDEICLEEAVLSDPGGTPFAAVATGGLRSPLRPDQPGAPPAVPRAHPLDHRG